jgi:hypothetical protein
VIPDPVPPIASWSVFRSTGVIVGLLAFVIGALSLLARIFGVNL